MFLISFQQPAHITY